MKYLLSRLFACHFGKLTRISGTTFGKTYGELCIAEGTQKGRESGQDVRQDDGGTSFVGATGQLVIIDASIFMILTNVFSHRRSQDVGTRANHVADAQQDDVEGGQTSAQLGGHQILLGDTRLGALHTVPSVRGFRANLAKDVRHDRHCGCCGE